MLQPQAVLIWDRDGVALYKYWADIKGDTSKEDPVIVVKVSYAQCGAIGIAKVFVLF